MTSTRRPTRKLRASGLGGSAGGAWPVEHVSFRRWVLLRSTGPFVGRRDVIDNICLRPDSRPVDHAKPRAAQDSTKNARRYRPDWQS